MDMTMESCRKFVEVLASDAPAPGGGGAAARAVAARWRELRASGLTAEAVIARAREMHEEIAGARMRDSLRWPQCGMGEGNAMNIRDIEDFVETMFVRMDAYIEELASDA